jgi:chromosome segregation ATPase
MNALAVLPSPEPAQTTATTTDAVVPGDAGEAEREHAAQRRREAIRAVEEARREMAKAEDTAAAAEDEALACAAAADDAARAAREAEVRWRRLQLEADSLQPRVAQTRARADKARQGVERLMAQLLKRENELAEWPDHN